MISQKTLKLYVYVDGVNDVPFYGDVSGAYEEFILSNGELYETPEGFVFNVRQTNEQIEIGNFRFDAKRMGGAPTISFTLMYEDCLDNFWSESVYATFNGEKYFLKQTPTSSLSNEDARYKHDVELISERVALDNVYFFDAVKGSSQSGDKTANSSTFAFFGNIVDFKNKLNASLRYAEMQTEENGVVSGWNVIIDDNITSEEKLISFDNVFFSNAIQESYNTFKIPYYFKGKEIHFGYTDNTIAKEFRYGIDDALLSITKSNANNKVVNRVTATGSSENLPYYYPNSSSKGNIFLSKSSNATFKIVDMEKFASEVAIDEVITYGAGKASVYSTRYKREQGPYTDISTDGISIIPNQDDSDSRIWFSIAINVLQKGNIDLNFIFDVTGKGQCDLADYARSASIQTNTGVKSLTIGNNKISLSNLEVGLHSINVGCSFPSSYGEYFVRPILSTSTSGGWYRANNEKIDLSKIGVSIISGTPSSGDTITQKLDKYINTSNVLLPPKYRETDGEQRFYNATNDTYEDDNGQSIVFTNPFVEGHPKEHIIKVEDIKPTIKEARNASNLRIDMFSEFAYDEGDNDETYQDDEGNIYFKHPYFYGKLRIMDFNLFDSANENQPMTISFTSGDVGACNFEIGVTEEYPQKNPVQVNANGNLLRDENGMVIAGVEGSQQEVTKFQDRQQDTSKYEVWIALKKEEETYGVLMPNGNFRPKACTSATANDGDTFVILGINLPQAYITKAEEKLEREIIKYMYENNVEKFKFSIKFSRIYFEENPDVLELLDENSRIYVWYNDVRYTLYVNSISYYMESDGVLPEITVELDENLTLTQNALQNAISQVRAQVGDAFSNIDIATLGTPYFIRKDQDDEVQGRINFKKGIKFGEGGRVDLYDNNSAKLTIEYLEVTKKATFTSLEIQEKTHVGGQMLISPAAMNCGEVESIYNTVGNLTAYRCYMQTKGQDGEEIFNQFVVGDQAICQTFNAWGSKYYWRLVTGVGEDYIDLSIDDCDEESDIPEAGDKIIQLGHRTDKSRQAAQVLSAHGETAPAFIMYNGINDYTLEGKEVTGILWNPATQEPQMYSYGNFFFGNREKDENGEFKKDFITFQSNPENPEEKKLFINADVQFGGGSKGLSDLSEWQDLQGEVTGAQGTADEAVAKALKALEDAETAQQTANTANSSITTVNTRIDGIDGTIAEINNKLDGVVESYFEKYVPTRTNLPASQWIADGTEADHIGDTFTNTETTGDNAGKSWRWLKMEDGSYDWQQIADSDAAKALALAGQAKAAADGKTTTFLVTPTNYSEGDIWIVGDSVPENFAFKKGDILTTNEGSVDYFASHWSKVINYNDEFQDELNTKVEELNDSISEAESRSKSYTDEGKAVLQLSIDELNRAKASVDDVYTKAQADGKISAAEQRAINEADSYAKKAQELAEINANAYADGVASVAELEAIAQAEKELNAAKEELDEAIKEVDTKANKALADAANAQKVADEATERMEEWASDGIISPMEKQALKNEKATVEADFLDIEKQFRKYIAEFDEFILVNGEYYETEDGYIFNVLVANTNWSTYQSAKESYIDELDSKINSEGNVAVGDLSTKQTNYYNARTSILEDISLAIKAEADYSKKTAQAADEQAKQAIDDAAAAKQAADAAAGEAQAANAELQAWTADGVISPVEKQALKNELAQIEAEFQDIQADCQKYGLTASYFPNFGGAYGQYRATLVNKINTSGTVEVGTLATDQSNYYKERTTILEAIAAAAKKIADDAMQSASEASRPNLLANSAELVIAATGSNTYKVLGLPITISTGDEFTFKAENIERLAGATNLVAVRMLSPDLQTAYANNTIGLGENKVLTFKITATGVSNAKAVFLLYAGTVNNTTGNTIRYTNFSLVKGTTAMATWEDYQGDNGLKNLLSVGETFEGQFTAYTYYGEGLPITVNAGEKYTFHIEDISMLSGTDSNGIYYCYLDDFNSNLLSDTASGYINQSGFGTITIREGVSNAKARFLISKNETSPNSATVRIKRMSLVKGTRPMMVWKENTDYLTNAFKNGSTKVSGGLVMTQAVVVANDAGTVKGMFNGSETFKDATHGTLMLAAGSEGAKEEQLAAATTRIYEDGHMVSNSMELKEGCNIAGIDVTSKGIEFTSADEGTAIIDDEGIRITNRVIGGQQVSAGIGECPQSAIQIAVGQSGNICIPTYTGNVGGIIVTTPSRQEAICCPSGMFSGMRPYTRAISHGDSITIYDHTLWAESGRIYLPQKEDVPYGQTYKIIHWSTSTLYIQSSALLRELKGSSGVVNASDNTIISEKAEVIEIWNGGTNWYFVRYSS